MSRKTKKVLGWSYALLVIAGLGFGISQALASPTTGVALNCFSGCPSEEACDDLCKKMNLGEGACVPMDQCCCQK